MSLPFKTAIGGDDIWDRVHEVEPNIVDNRTYTSPEFESSSGISGEIEVEHDINMLAQTLVPVQFP